MVRYNLYNCFLDFFHRLYFNKTTTFRKLDLLPSSGKKGRTETLAVGPGPGLRLAQPGFLQRSFSKTYLFKY
jgi:hypothetical protein